MKDSRREETGKGPGGGHGFGPRIGMPVEKAKNFKVTLKRLLGYLKPYRYLLILVFLLALFSNLFAIISPKLLGNATTVLFEGMMQRLEGVPGATVDFSTIKEILTLLFFLYLFSAFFGFLQQYLMAGVAQKTVYSLRRDVNRKLARLPLNFYDSRKHGEILSRVVNDIDNISNTLQQSLTQLITAFITFVGVLIMMAVISPLLTLIVILTIPLSMAVVFKVASKSQKYFKGQQAFLGELNGHVEEMFAGHIIVKAFGREEKAIEEFDTINESLYRDGWKAQFISGMIMPLMSFITNVSYVLVSVVGGILVINRTIPIGDVQAFIQYTRQISHPITQVANISNIIQSTVASAERVFVILEEEEEIDINIDYAVINDPQGQVSFRDVAFSYKKDETLIQNLNLDVAKGQKVAIVGPTGAGKTTLINLLMGFYEIDRGTITIDGVDIRKMRKGDLRSLFGMVLQDTWLFNGTIRDNIGYGREGATDAEIFTAAKAAHADHFIRTLPEGYNTVLNEETSNLSQGQKQLLTIARAVLADPHILILDEATSSVDTRTEADIQKAMKDLMKGRTSFVIAHRLSTIRDADVVLVMNEGRIIEQGSHQELLVQNGFYADLYKSQFAATVGLKWGRRNE